MSTTKPIGQTDVALLRDPASYQHVIDRVIERGVRLARATLSDTYLTVGGVPKTVGKMEARDRVIRLETVAEVLDLLQWYGPWGTTVHGIKMELLRRAKA